MVEDDAEELLEEFSVSNRRLMLQWEAAKKATR